ncbi:MAG: hypothetical protein JOZ36_00490, partial [Acidobacteria bacterium]|nr:hypothetical protein [Acidobacteriota bacterium]
MDKMRYNTSPRPAPWDLLQHLFENLRGTDGGDFVLLWFYLTGAAILIGGVINSVIEHAAAAKPGKPDLKKPSAR